MVEANLADREVLGRRIRLIGLLREKPLIAGVFPIVEAYLFGRSGWRESSLAR
jgi:hypothetical protein